MEQQELARPKQAGWGKNFQGCPCSTRRALEGCRSLRVQGLELMASKDGWMMGDETGKSGRRGKSVVGA